MACGSSCYGSVQTGITSLEDDVQEHPKPPARTADLSAFKASRTTRASSKIRNISSLRNCCCSPVRHDASITPPAQSGSRRSSNVPKSTPSVSKQCSKSTEADSCCGKRLPSVVTDASTSEGCCTTSVTEYPQPTANDNAARLPVSQNELAGCCAETASKIGCCSSEKKTDTRINTLDVQPNKSEIIDVEKAGSDKEHVILSVSGMTCTGCETKLQRTLATLPYVRQLRISLILARAEFEIAGNTATVEDVIKHLTRTTEFKCEQVSTQGSSIDLTCTGKAAMIADGVWPEGVLNIRILDKDVVRVAYDANSIGARDLIEKRWDSIMQLAPMRLDPSLDAGNRHVWHMGLLTLLSGCLTIPVLVMAWAPLPDRDVAYSSASFALATIVQVCIAGPFYPKALKALIYSRVIEMDLLIVLSTSAAYVFSVVSFGYKIADAPLPTGEFFETSTLLVTLIMVGRWVASLARQKAAESISIRSLQTCTAILVESEGQDKAIDVRLLQYGDVFKVVPDTQIPTDGTVIAGSSEVDETMLTGESVPVVKLAGSSVIAGSLNGPGTLTIRLTRLPGDNTITTIASMVDEAKLSKPRIQDIADRVASYFVPVVVGLTIVTFIIWVAIGLAVRKQSGSDAVIEAVTYAIAVLIVSCPCAIGLAVPMVIVIATGVAARHGVIFKTAASIEVAYKTTDVILDKTGTLTLGRPQVVEEVSVSPNPSTFESLLLGLLADIKHPISAAITSHLSEKETTRLPVQGAKVITGNGVEGLWQGQLLRAGNARWLSLDAHPLVRSLLSKGLTVTCFTIDGDAVAVYGLQDTLRPETSSVILELQRRNIAVHVLSGDDDGAVQSIARQLLICGDHVRSRCSPADKRAYVEALQAGPVSPQASRKKARKPIVMFIGDGTNDAVALAQSTIGVHMSSGTDIAQSAADVVLIRSDLSGILTLLTISKRAMHRVTFNFGWSFFYNLFAVLLGAGAFVNARIPPEFAGLGELVSVLPVIAAAVLLRWPKV